MYYFFAIDFRIYINKIEKTSHYRKNSHATILAEKLFDFSL